MVIPYWDKFNLFNPDEVDDGIDKQAGICYSPPFWSLITRPIGDFLLTLNASVCSIMYCAVSRPFRSEVLSRFRKLKKNMPMFVSSSVNHEEENPTDNRVVI